MLLMDLTAKCGSEWEKGARTAWVAFFNTMLFVVNEKVLEMEHKRKIAEENKEEA